MNDQEIGIFITSLILTVVYIVYQRYINWKYSQIVSGPTIAMLTRLMQWLQVMAVVALFLEWIFYYNTTTDVDYAPVWVDFMYAICEMVLYVVDGLQSLLLFTFLFKFKQVEIEILMQLEDPKTILKMLKKLKIRVRTTVISIFALIVFFSLSYMICELLWFINIGWFIKFYGLGKTI